jgi:hypothetical protein
MQKLSLPNESMNLRFHFAMTSMNLERLCMQVMTLSRKIEGDREILNMFSKAPDLIKAKATRTFVEMMKLVPSCYSHIKVMEKSVIAETYPITLEHDGGSYDFEPYVVEVDLDKGKVLISGGTECKLTFIHTLSDDPSNICWGNIGHLVSRLTGELDLHGLLQLVHQFLHSYNSSAIHFRRSRSGILISQDDNEDDEPYCSWCDDYGHDISDCEILLVVRTLSINMMTTMTTAALIVQRRRRRGGCRCRTCRGHRDSRLMLDSKIQVEATRCRSCGCGRTLPKVKCLVLDS